MEISPIIHGVLRQKELMSIVGPTRSCKTKMAMSLCAAVSSGSPWLRFETEKNKVLLVHDSNEDSICKQARECGCNKRSLSLLKARSNSGPIIQAEECLNGEKFGIIVIDGFEKFVTETHSNGEIEAFYKDLNKLSEESGSAIVLSINRLESPEVADSIPGVGSRSRLFDTSMDIFESDEGFEVKISPRSFPPINRMKLFSDDGFLLKWAGG